VDLNVLIETGYIFDEGDEWNHDVFKEGFLFVSWKQKGLLLPKSRYSLFLRK
jgi:hypothetical protein